MTPEREKKFKSAISKRQSSLTVIMEHVHDPHNISAVMRSCDAVGISDLYIIQEARNKEYQFGKRSSASALKWLNVHIFDHLEDCYEAVRAKYDTILTTHLSKEASSIYETDLTSSVAIVFGNEHAGVTDQAVELADGNLVIPQMGMIQSLNISVACAVTLYETLRQRDLKGMYNGQELTAAEQESMFQAWSIKKYSQ